MNQFYSLDDNSGLDLYPFLFLELVFFLGCTCTLLVEPLVLACLFDKTFPLLEALGLDSSAIVGIEGSLAFLVLLEVVFSTDTVGFKGFLWLLSDFQQSLILNFHKDNPTVLNLFFDLSRVRSFTKQ